jgi:tryptophanyl-tRNA synthetase
LQKVFNCPLVIQITGTSSSSPSSSNYRGVSADQIDDEKYLLERDSKKQAELLKKIDKAKPKGSKKSKPIDLLRHYKQMGQENIKDIIACGFDPAKTFICSDLAQMG